MRAACVPAVASALLLLAGCNRGPAGTETEADRQQRAKAASDLIDKMESGAKGAYVGTGNVAQDLRLQEASRKIDEIENGAVRK